MRWPRGRHNGRRIVGLELKLIVDVEQLGVRRFWLPYARRNFGEPFLIWLFFQVRFYVRYGPDDRLLSPSVAQRVRFSRQCVAEFAAMKRHWITNQY